MGTPEANKTYYSEHREERLAYYRAHREERAPRVREYHRGRYERVHTDLRAFKLLRGCIDCGYDENADALQLDHVRGVKLGNVAHLQMGSPDVLAAEIAKCEVRCANCHAVATGERRRAARST